MRRVNARYTWDVLRVSFWFAPAVMAVIAVLLAWFMYWLDGIVPNEALDTSRVILSGDVASMRSALLGMATTTLATAGVVFTLLTLPLSTVAAQYGSRLLRVFLGDRTTQFVLAMFVGTFVYCIAAALSIPPAELQPEAPQITTTVALLLMLASFGSLIWLVQHVSVMLQAPNIAAAAGAELLNMVFAETPAEPARSPVSPAVSMAAAGDPLRVSTTGYIQTADPEFILVVARENDLVVHLLCKPGSFVSPNTIVARVWPQARLTPRVEAELRRAIRIGNQRTPTQDVGCAVNQLVEMAVRAMSPAINDPFTAITCLDHLGNGLALFAQQGGESLNTYDDAGQLRLIFEPVTLSELLDSSFDMLRHASCDNATVLLHMLGVIATIGQKTDLPAARQDLLRHVRLIEAESAAGALIEHDRQRILARSASVAHDLMLDLAGTTPLVEHAVAVQMPSGILPAQPR
ncbi:MAG: DUF2254 domain-containing protein [Caldilineaceae bacterium]